MFQSCLKLFEAEARTSSFFNLTLHPRDYYALRELKSHSVFNIFLCIISFLKWFWVYKSQQIDVIEFNTEKTCFITNFENISTSAI